MMGAEIKRGAYGPTDRFFRQSVGRRSGAARGFAELASVTIVIEWDNAARSDLARPLGMLRALYWQLREMRGAFRARPEIRVLYDGAKVEVAIIERLMSEAVGDAPWPRRSSWRVSDGRTGCARHGNRRHLFLDSDVIPEPDWLKCLMESFRDPRVSVVGGGTYVALDDLLGKAFALFWFFPLRDEANDLAATGSFFANNVAFRRKVALPRCRFQFRSAECSLLAAELRTGSRHLPPPGRTCLASSSERARVFRPPGPVRGS